MTGDGGGAIGGSRGRRSRSASSVASGIDSEGADGGGTPLVY